MSQISSKTFKIKVDSGIKRLYPHKISLKHFSVLSRRFAMDWVVIDLSNTRKGS